MKNFITIKKQVYYTALLLISFAFHFTVEAQQPLECPEPKVSKEQLQRMLQYSKNAATSKTQSSNIQVRVFAHIVADDDGARPGATPADILTEISTMQGDFAPGDICFIYMGYDHINSTLLNNINVDTHDDKEELFEAHLVSKCLNIFYTHQIRGKNPASGGGYGGITFDLPNTYCLVANGSLGKHTSSHEAGHCFGLFHTFDHDRFGYENINGDDCDDDGDLICDTRADPYAYRGQFCYSSQNGIYTGYCTDPNGQSNFDPPYNNIMSYWHHDPESFTLGQTQLMDVTIIAESKLYELTTSSSNFNFGPVTYNYEQTFKSAKSSITTLGNIELLQISKTGLTAKKIIVNPGFHAKPLPDGFTLLKASECSGVTLKPAVMVPEIKNTNDALVNKIQDGLHVFPNPSTGKFMVELQTGEIKTGSATMLFTNSIGKTLWTKYVIVVNGKIKEQVIAGNEIKSGVYFITIIMGDKRYQTQIVISK